ncbi:hypothetical protein Adt_37302 [Abeliophyllum distichum]|uniref:Uncharacterized protein n=1 Tax=Abeliophyllum distichum TaxID=126358 RepID=A0ABD1QKI4_9LAMI
MATPFPINNGFDNGHSKTDLEPKSQKRSKSKKEEEDYSMCAERIAGLTWLRSLCEINVTGRCLAVENDSAAATKSFPHCFLFMFFTGLIDFANFRRLQLPPPTLPLPTSAINWIDLAPCITTMFTDGLDEKALNWVKKGSDGEQSVQWTEKLEKRYPLPKSPLAYSSSGYTSSHVLPPLKFHSGLLGPRSTMSLSVGSDEDDSDDYNDNESESVGSGPDEIYGNHSDEEMVERPVIKGFDEGMFSLNSSTSLNHSRGNGEAIRYGSTINRGLSKEDLKIEVPGNVRRYTGGEWGFGGHGQNSAVSDGSCRFHEKIQPRSAYGTPMGNLNDMAELGTPSAPPVMHIGREVRDFELGNEQINNQVNMAKESEQCFSGDEVVFSGQIGVPVKSELDEREDEETLREKEPPTSVWHANSMNHSPYYDASGQNAWQVLVAYDACIRLCLNAWARGCTEAPEFLRDECLLLRNAFGLHKLLLQPRGVKPEESTNKTREQARPLKVKRIVGKIRLEVKKLRIIPRRKLKNTNSMLSAIYIQAGADYVRHVSSLVKHGINSLKLSPFSSACEESLSCLVQLKSSAENNEVEPGSTISLHPGSGEYHDFFPESQGDVLLLEVQDIKKNVQGQATVPISSMTDNPNDRTRWWPIYQNDHECVGKVLLFIGSTFTSDETVHMKSGPIVETLAYDLLLEAAMRAHQFHARNLRIVGPWKWLLTEFAEYYGVSDSYTKLRFLSYVMDVATPTKDCLEFVHELLVPVIKARNERSLTRQEKSILLDCETQVESLLADVFQNYKSLDENSPTGLTDLSAPTPETAGTGHSSCHTSVYASS